MGSFGLTGFMVAFISVVVGLTLFTSIADTTGSLTQTYSVENVSFTALNSTAVVFAGTGQNVTVISEVRNNVSAALSSPTNYTSSVAGRSVTMNVNYSANTGFASQTWYVDYSYQTNDYIDNGAARSVTNLINVFFAIAILAGALMAVDFKNFKF